MAFPSLRFTRRQFLTAAFGLSAAWLIARPNLFSSASPEERLVWAWQFDRDGEPNQIGRRLLDNNLGLILKTHDGPRWMAQFDGSQYAVTGGGQVRVLASYFEDSGIPFHAWAVVQGTEPAREAVMAAEVLSSGVRSLYIDLGAAGETWLGDEEDARTFAEDLRRLQPDARIILVADARPWINNELPLDVLEPVCDGVTIKALWTAYGDEDAAGYEALGYSVPHEGMTPEFVYAVAVSETAWVQKPRTWIADGAEADAEVLDAFFSIVRNAGEGPASIWRYGITTEESFTAIAAQPQPEAYDEYTVQAGDTLSVIAANHAISVEELVEANGLEDVDVIVEGQVLRVPLP